MQGTFRLLFTMLLFVLIRQMKPLHLPDIALIIFVCALADQIEMSMFWIDRETWAYRVCKYAVVGAFLCVIGYLMG